MATDAASPARLTIWSQVKALTASPMAPYYFIAASVAVLAGLGTLMVLSASSVLAMYSGLDPYYYVTRQVLFLGVGLVFAVVFSRINADFIRRLGWPAWMLAVALLVLVRRQPELARARPRAVPALGVREARPDRVVRNRLPHEARAAA